MARARGCILPAVLAGTAVGWAVGERIAAAQGAAEVREDLGDSYQLARLTTAQGSIIETLLFDGQTIVTDVVLPAPGAGKSTGTSGPAAELPAVNANASPRDAAALPPGLGSGFVGTWLTGEIIDGYLVLHRIRADDPVAHDIFRDGLKVGSVAEVGPPIRAGRAAGRNSFAFERTDDRFVVHLRQPDGTAVHATTEHGRFLNQVVERSASPAAPPRAGAGVAIAPGRPPDAVRPAASPSPEPQRPAPPRETAGPVVVNPVMMKEAALPSLARPEAGLAPSSQPVPLPRTRPAIPARAAALAEPKPGLAPVAPERSSRSAKPNGRAEETSAPAAKSKMTVASENAQRRLRGAERPVTPVARPLPQPWNTGAEQPVTAAERSSLPPAWGVGAQTPVAPTARPSLPSPWNPSVQYWQYGR
jgi:hypothetical protein